MHKLVVFIFPLASFLIGCGGHDIRENTSDPLTQKNNSPVNSTAPDSNCAISAAKNMLQWYKANHAKMDAVELVNTPALTDTNRFKINFSYVEKYIAIIRSSGLFTEGFLRNKYVYFRQCDDTLARTHQNDGPPPCLSYDLFLFTQEPDGLLEHLDSAKFSIGKGPANGIIVTKLTSLWTNLAISVRMIDGKCLIDEIKIL